MLTTGGGRVRNCCLDVVLQRAGELRYWGQHPQEKTRRDAFLTTTSRSGAAFSTQYRGVHFDNAPDAESGPLSMTTGSEYLANVDAS